ncbi:MAG TPA: hypothetical protein VHO48_03830 [Anaerolineaceae bacterium]|jgi:hypothetical protein|nr:hypothetical protein [Anaerolineaceae bacterium]
MPRIRCHYLDCVFLDEGYCSAAAIEVDPDSGCMTYSPTAEMANTEEDWEEEEEMEEWEELDSEEDEDEDLWVEDDEEY